MLCFAWASLLRILNAIIVFVLNRKLSLHSGLLYELCTFNQQKGTTALWRSGLAREAHNLEVPRSKRGSARWLQSVAIIFLFVLYYYESVLSKLTGSETVGFV